METTYLPEPPEVAWASGRVLLEFGVDGCPYCEAARLPIAHALTGHPALVHFKVEDGPGRPLGRRFRVKRWPTLILLAAGLEVGRVIRPTTADAVRALIEADSN